MVQASSGRFESHHVDEIRSRRKTAWNGRERQGKEGIGYEYLWIGRDKDRDGDG